MNELDLQTEMPVMFYGEITSFSEGYIQLSESLKNIKFALNPTKLRFSQYFDDLPEHRYYTLFSSYYLYWELIFNNKEWKIAKFRELSLN